MITYFVQGWSGAENGWVDARDGATDNAVAEYDERASALAFYERKCADKPDLVWRVVMRETIVKDEPIAASKDRY